MKIPFWFNENCISKIVKVSFTSEGVPDILTKNHVLLYLAAEGKEVKLGEIVKAEGRTPLEAFFVRYASKNSSSLETGKTSVKALLVLDKQNDKPKNYDTEARNFINDYHRWGRCKYFCPGNDGKGNKERIENFDGDIDGLISILSYKFNNVPIKQDQFRFRNCIQKKHLHKANSILSEHGKVLLAFFTAYGKTYLIPKLICDNCEPGDVALVTTPILDTMIDCVDRIKTIYYGKKLYPVTDESIRDKSTDEILCEIKKKKREGYIVVIIVSVQNLRYNDLDKNEKTKLREKFSFLNKRVSLWIRDEYHREYNGVKTSEIFKNIQTKYTVDMTASTYKLLTLYGSEYSNKKIMFDYFDAKASDKFPGLPKIKLSLMDFNATNISESIRSMYSAEEGYDPRKTFLLENGRFVNEKALVEEFRCTYDGVYDSAGRVYPISGRKNPLAIFDDTDVKDKKVVFHVVPEGSDGNTTQEIQRKLKDLCNENVKDRKFYTATDLKKESKNNNVQNVINVWISEAEKENRRDGIVVFTHRQFLTGTNVHRLGMIVLSDKVGSPDEFLQMIGRLFREYNGKKCAKMFIRCPGMELTVPAFVYNVLKDKNISEKQKKIYYDSLPIVSYDGEPRRISYEDAFRAYREEMNKIFERSQLTTAVISSKFPDVVKMIKGMPFDDLKSKDKTATAPITPKNGAKVSKKQQKEQEKKERKHIEGELNTLKSIVNEVPSIGIIHNCKSVSEIADTSLFKNYFSKNNRNLFLASLRNEEFHSSLNDWYLSKKANPKNDDLFVNTDWKAKKGLVHLPEDFTGKFVGKTFRFCKKCDTILVWNALNGILPVYLRDKYGKARIVCVEPHPYYIPYLRKLGFETYDYNNIPKEIKDMKFDLNILNPPFQEPLKKEAKGGSRGKDLWDKFAKDAITATKDGGHVAIILPCMWRKPDAEMYPIISQYQVEYIEMHAAKKHGGTDYREVGINIFGVWTAFDCIILHKVPYYKPTLVNDFSGKQHEIDLREWPWLPGGQFSCIKKILAKKNDKKCEIIFSQSAYETRKEWMSKTETKCEIIYSRSAYGSDKKWMSKTETKKYKYPCFHANKKGGGFNYWYSSRNDKGHFGISKVIFSDGGYIRPYNDYKGEYGMTQHAMAIPISSKKEGELICKALNSDKFKKIVWATKWSGYQTAWTMFTYFKKDFWKYFV